MTFTMVGKQTKSYSVEIANSTGDVSYEFPALPDSQPVSSVAVDQNYALKLCLSMMLQTTINRKDDTHGKDDGYKIFTS